MRILLGFDAGICAELSTQLVERLRARGHTLRLTWTRSSSTKPPVSEKFEDARSPDPFSEGHAAVDHIAWARWPELVLVVGASPSLIARLAQGRAEDFLGLVALATRAPIVVVTDMPEPVATHPAVRENIEQLEKHGVRVYAADFLGNSLDVMLESFQTRTSDQIQNPSAANVLLK